MRMFSAPDTGPSDCPNHRALSALRHCCFPISGFPLRIGRPCEPHPEWPGIQSYRFLRIFESENRLPKIPVPATGTILYGGEFADNDPSSNAFGNCDLAIDLGAQDAKSNGLYPTATVFVTASFPKTASARLTPFKPLPLPVKSAANMQSFSSEWILPAHRRRLGESTSCSPIRTT